jgi:hypothetical protein
MTGPVGFVLMVLIIGPYVGMYYLGRWVLDRYDRDIEARIKLNETLTHKGDVGHRCVANDRQQVVIWSTFYPDCKSNKSGDAALRLCGHLAHPQAGTNEPAFCDEELCPKLSGKPIAA